MPNQFPLQRPETHYMIVSNEMIDVIMREVSGNAFKVLFVIYRHTEGWNKPSDAISISQLQRMTGIATRETVINAVRELESKNLIKATRAQNVTTEYSINQNYQIPQVGAVGKSDKQLIGKSDKISGKLVGKSDTQKTGEYISKDKRSSSSPNPKQNQPAQAGQGKATDALGNSGQQLAIPAEAQGLWKVISRRKREELAGRLSKHPQAYSVLLEQFRAAVAVAAGNPDHLAGIYINKITDALAYLEMPPVVIDLDAPVDIPTLI